MKCSYYHTSKKSLTKIFFAFLSENVLKLEFDANRFFRVKHSQFERPCFQKLVV